MKLVRLVLVTAFLLSLGGNAAFAARSEAQYGYIALTNQGFSDAQTFEAQVMANYRVLYPRLIDAKSEGIILDFKPLFGMGILAVKYPSGANPEARLNKPVLGDGQAALAQTAQRQFTTLASRAPTGPYYIFNNDYPCFTGFNQGAGKRVGIKIQTGAGRVVGAWEDTADGSGYISGCFWGPLMFETNLVGYKLTVRRYNGNTLLSTYSSTVPLVTIDGFFPYPKRIWGTAPAGKNVSVTFWHPNLNQTNTILVKTFTAKTAADKSWEVLLGTTPMRGGDWAEVQAHDSLRFFFSYEQVIPYLSITPYENDVYYSGFPKQDVKIELAQGAKVYSRIGNTTSDGDLTVYFENDKGEPLNLTWGDYVQATYTRPYKVPQTTAVLKAATDTVSGVTQPRSWFWVVLSMGNMEYGRWVRSNANGAYTADFSADVDIRPSCHCVVSLYLTDRISGTDVYGYTIFAP